MTKHVDLAPFFEREEGSEGFPSESYEAGFREAGGRSVVSLRLPAETVERAVLTGARLSVWLAPDGHLELDAEGISDEALEAARAAGGLGEQTLLPLITACLDPENLGMQDQPLADLTALRTQLSDALTRVDEMIERLKKE